MICELENLFVGAIRAERPLTLPTSLYNERRNQTRSSDAADVRAYPTSTKYANLLSNSVIEIYQLLRSSRCSHQTADRLPTLKLKAPCYSSSIAHQLDSHTHEASPTKHGDGPVHPLAAFRGFIGEVESSTPGHGHGHG